MVGASSSRPLRSVVTVSVVAAKGRFFTVTSVLNSRPASVRGLTRRAALTGADRARPNILCGGTLPSFRNPQTERGMCKSKELRFFFSRGGLALASPSLRPSSSISPAEPFALPFASTPVCVYAAPTRIPHSLGEGAWFACCVVLVSQSVSR